MFDWLTDKVRTSDSVQGTAPLLQPGSYLLELAA
jgi:hypothetical protein